MEICTKSKVCKLLKYGTLFKDSNKAVYYVGISITVEKEVQKVLSVTVDKKLYKYNLFHHLQIGNK